MIRIHIAQLDSDARGRPKFETLDLLDDVAVEIDGTSVLDVCAVLQARPQQIDRVIYSGRAYAGEELTALALTSSVNGQHDLHVIPSLEGKNAALILGVVGAVVGAFLVPGSIAFSWAVIQGALTGYALGSTVGSLLAPRPRQALAGDDAMTSYLWQGIVNEDRAGTSIPVVLGEHRTAGTRISSWIRRVGNKERMGVLILVSRGERAAGEGRIESIDDVRINDQPSSNFPDITIVTRMGTTPQTIISGFESIANTFAQSVDLTDLNADYIYSTNRQIDAFEVLLTLAGLSHTDDKGNIKDNVTRYSIEYKRTGVAEAWTNLDAPTNYHEVKSSTRSTLFETRRAEGLPLAQYDIKLRWLDTTATQKDVSRDQWHIFLTGVTEETQDLRTYDGDALLAITGIATEQLNGRLPNVTCLCRGVRVPVWNGSSFEAAAWIGPDATRPVGRNNAWLTLELIRNKVWGAGEEFADVDINLNTFKQWADFCNENALVTLPNGGSYNEPRCQLDIVLNQTTNAHDLIMQLAQSGRANIVMSEDGQLSVVIDRDEAYVQTFTMGNIERGSFALQYQSKLGAANSLDVTINDRDRDYEPNSKLVVSHQQVEVLGKPIRQQQITRVGTTRMTQAVRDSRVDLNAMHNVRRVGSFRAFADAILAQAGDVIRIAHDVPQWGYSGRVIADGTNNQFGIAADRLVYLDQPIFIDATQAYEITLIHAATGTEEIVAVNGGDQINGTGITNVIVLAVSPSRMTEYGDQYAFGPVNISAKPFRIIEISLSDESRRKIDVIEVVAGVHDDTGNIAPTPYSQLPNVNGLPGPITDLQITEEKSNRKDDRWISTLLVQWTISDAGRVYGKTIGSKVERSWNYDPLNPSTASWEEWEYTEGTEARWYDAPHGLLLAFRVTPRALRGYNMLGARIGYKLTDGYSVAPAALANFRASTKENTFVFEWDDPGQEFQIELRNANSGWGDDDPTRLVWRGRGSKFTVDTPSARSMTLYAKVIDMNHNFSVGAVSATVTDAAPLAPSITAILRSKNSLKVTVAPNGLTSDHLFTYLHASQTPGFTPSDANRVAQIISARGGDFVFDTPTSGSWYFRAGIADWLSLSLNDIVYSGESSQSIILISPVDPSAVSLVAPKDTDSETIVRNPDNTVRPTAKRVPRVTWGFSDLINPANSLVGFQVVIYDSTTGNPITGPVAYDSGVMPNPAARSHELPDVRLTNTKTYIAAVKAVYIDGLTSNYVTSAGLTIPLETNPKVRDQDDRNVRVYTEGFHLAVSIPTGITIDNSGSGHSVVVDTTRGELIVTLGSGGNLGIRWALATWAAAYIDKTHSIDDAEVAVRLRIEQPHSALPAAPLLSIITAGTGYAGNASTEPVIDDDKMHTYYALAGKVPSPVPSDMLIFIGASGWPAGVVIRVTAIEVGALSTDQELDGFMDRALNGRKQFDRDPSLLGFFLKSPVHGLDDTGQLTVLDQNGMVVVRTDGGVEGTFKRRRNALMSDSSDGSSFLYDTAYTGAGAKLDPPIPTPTACNLARFLLQGAGTSTVDSTQAAGVIVRRYDEIVNITATGFRVGHSTFYGGTQNVYRASVAGATASAKRAISFLSARGPADANAAHGWYDFAGRGIPTGVVAYYRMVAWIAVTMPTLVKANGKSTYYSILSLSLSYGAPLGGSPNANNPASIDTTIAGYIALEPITILCRTDGKVWRYPIVIGGAVFSGAPPLGLLKIDYYNLATELGGGGSAAPTLVELDAVEFHYMSGASYLSPVNQAFDLLFLEAFA